jgi:hypothetical protein
MVGNCMRMMIDGRLCRCLALLAPVALAACATTPPVEPPPEPPPPRSVEPPPSHAPDLRPEPAAEPEQGAAGMPEPAEETGEAADGAPAAARQDADEAGPEPTHPAARGTTPQEHRDRAQNRLDRSLAGFDERLKREQDAIAAAAEQQAEAERAAAAGAASMDGFEEGLGEPGQPPPAGSAAGDDDEALPSERMGGAGDRPDLPVPADIPDGQDDDIVARQLREAAENETDPELREKLWEEYRAYKASTR